ncbi:hypothetical protein ATO11_00505 [Pseudaestuariivita atlantica]|uniref:DUF2946 domain-containing protein n=2 Tax=Pseudaestuariivita atlantica TaxID=1317121 RepID=A0A0L1JUS9_9RHOB|nr:hypothetical protein ATO11_00505 [Pseudaestuariivita atlantica]
MAGMAPPAGAADHGGMARAMPTGDAQVRLDANGTSPDPATHCPLCVLPALIAGAQGVPVAPLAQRRPAIRPDDAPLLTVAAREPPRARAPPA